MNPADGEHAAAQRSRMVVPQYGKAEDVAALVALVVGLEGQVDQRDGVGDRRRRECVRGDGRCDPIGRSDVDYGQPSCRCSTSRSARLS